MFSIFVSRWSPPELPRCVDEFHPKMAWFAKREAPYEEEEEEENRPETDEEDQDEEKQPDTDDEQQQQQQQEEEVDDKQLLIFKRLRRAILEREHYEGEN